MKLAIVRRRFASAGGAESFIVNSSSALGRAGVDVTLVAEGQEGSDARAGQWLRLPAAKGSRAHRYRAFQKAVTQAIGYRAFDVVQAHERVLTADIFRAGDGVHAAWIERLNHERAAWRRPLTQLDPYHRLLMQTEGRMARETGMIFVANSAMVAREIAGLLDVPKSRLRTIENGVDLERFRPPTADEREAARCAFALSSDDRVVAFVGSGFDRKGAFALAKALALPALAGVKALIAGRDKYSKELARRVDNSGLADRVRLLGAVDDVRPVLLAADMLVLPTLYDPMPNATLEAIACGLPVVTTDDAGIADQLRETGAGAVSTRSPDDIAGKIIDVFGRLDEAAEAARGLRGRFDIADKTEEWLNLYREIA